MRKQAISLALALVMCLGLTVPAFAAGAKAGDTAVSVEGNTYNLSNPIIRIDSVPGNIAEMIGDREFEGAYVVPAGTIITKAVGYDIDYLCSDGVGTVEELEINAGYYYPIWDSPFLVFYGSDEAGDGNGQAELRDGITLTGIVGEEQISASPVPIQCYDVDSSATLVISGCGQLDASGSARKSGIFTGMYEAVQRPLEKPADWDDSGAPYIPGEWLHGDTIAELTWTENGVYTFDGSFAGKCVFLELNEEWESVNPGSGNGLPSAGTTSVLLRFPGADTPPEPDGPDAPAAYQVSDWARDRVALAVETGLAPEGLGTDYRVSITRAQFAATAVKLYEAMSGETIAPASSNPFTDTDDPEVLKAAAAGFVGGVGGGKFAPDDLLTREQAAVMFAAVYTKLGGEIPAVEATAFADDASISSWARNAVAFMNSSSIISGTGNNSFSPQGQASIEQALLIALNMFENLK